jgi:hypothetical protein
MKVDARKLCKQDAWYYLPYGNDHCVSVYQQGRVLSEIRILARKLLRELKAVLEDKCLS